MLVFDNFGNILKWKLPKNLFGDALRNILRLQITPYTGFSKKYKYNDEANEILQSGPKIGNAMKKRPRRYINKTLKIIRSKMRNEILSLGKNICAGFKIYSERHNNINPAQL